MIFDVQFSPARCSWPEYRDAVLAAEDAGFSTVWTLDHLSGAAFSGHTMLECFTLLGALAVATSRIGLGSLVANAANRHPGLLAAAATTAQELSDGRLILGLGAGASPTSYFASEQHVVGAPIAPTMGARHALLEQSLDLLDAQWVPDRSDRWNGFPQPDPVPPVLLGVNSPALAAIAGARTRGINVRWNHHNRAELLAAARDAHGVHDPAWISSVWVEWDDTIFDPSHPLHATLADEGVNRIILAVFTPPDLSAIERAGAALR